MSKSLLVSNVSHEADGVKTFPVLIGNEIEHFHSVEGEFDNQNGQHVLRLVHEVQGPGSPYRVDAEQLSHDFEIHIDDYYNLDVSGVTVEDNYPDEDYVIELHVDSYESGPYSFNSALMSKIDGRETKYE
jgi:hypothetical protein